jgi:hypothetical protein
MLKRTIMTLAVIGLAATMTDLEAKRVGGGRTSGTSRPAAAKPTPKAEEPAAASSTTNIRPRINVSSPSSSQNPAPGAVPAAAAAGVAAAGAAAAGTTAVAAPAPDPGLDAAEMRRRNEEKLLRAAEEEQKRRDLDTKRAAALAAFEQEQADRQKRLTKEKQDRDARRARVAHESQCQFKPVMSEDDLTKCRMVYR